jgi:hypothetical protein
MKWIFVILALITHARAEDPSAYRSLDIPFEHYEEKALMDGEIEFKSLSNRTSPLKSAVLYDKFEAPKMRSWAPAKLQARFEEIRDFRFFEDGDKFRKVSWKYPDDGCYSRASIGNLYSFRALHPLPHKVFAFGSLRVKTNNSPRGVVGWWYHVAPIIEVGTDKYVLDPSINYERPLLLSEWLDKMGKKEKMKVAICDSGTYSPSDSCSKKTDGLELRAQRAQQHYLDKEYERLKRLGRLSEL